MLWYAKTVLSNAIIWDHTVAQEVEFNKIRPTTIWIWIIIAKLQRILRQWRQVADFNLYRGRCEFTRNLLKISFKKDYNTFFLHFSERTITSQGFQK